MADSVLIDQLTEGAAGGIVYAKRVDDIPEGEFRVCVIETTDVVLIRDIAAAAWPKLASGGVVVFPGATRRLLRNVISDCLDSAVDAEGRRLTACDARLITDEMDGIIRKVAK